MIVCSSSLRNCLSSSMTSWVFACVSASFMFVYVASAYPATADNIMVAMVKGSLFCMSQ